TNAINNIKPVHSTSEISLVDFEITAPTTAEAFGISTGNKRGPKPVVIPSSEKVDSFLKNSSEIGIDDIYKDLKSGKTSIRGHILIKQQLDPYLERIEH